MVKKNNRLEWFNHWRQDRVKPCETWNSYCTWSSRGPEGHHVARANEALRDVPSITSSTWCSTLRKLWFVGNHCQSLSFTLLALNYNIECAHSQPHAPAFRTISGCDLSKPLLLPFFSVVGTELAQSAHTHTSQRDVKQILLSELFDSVCADSVYTYLSPRENLNII